jgi:Holliday junction resolvase
MKPEATVIDQIKKWVKSHGGKVIKINQSGFSELGTPDLICMLPEKGMFMVEAKAKGKKPEPIQIQRIKEINQHGGRAFCADSLESFKEQLRAKEIGINCKLA